jgi:hypothetical protein
MTHSDKQRPWELVVATGAYEQVFLKLGSSTEVVGGRRRSQDVAEVVRGRRGCLIAKKKRKTEK